MINRRNVLAGAASLALVRTASAAEDWKAKYPEITFAVIPAENGSGVTERYTPFVDYLSKELGIKVTLRVANDYAAVIEGQRAGNIQIGYYGPASFARALRHRRQDRRLRDRRQFRRLQGLLFGVLRAGQEPVPEARGPQGQEPRPGRSELDLRQQHAALQDEPDGHRSRQVLLAGGVHRQPRERRAGAGAGHRRCLRQLVERRRRFEPDPHAVQEHGQIERRHPAEEGGLPHHREVRPHHQLALRLSRQTCPTT